MFGNSATTVQHRKFSVADYYRMADAGIFGKDDRVELIEGKVIALTSIGSRRVSRVARRCFSRRRSR